MSMKALGHVALAVFIGVSVIWPWAKSFVKNSHFFAPKHDADPVKVSIYDEALCPDCREFIKNQLAPAWENLGDIMDVEVNAYGWTKEESLNNSRSGYNFTCQHGADECISNMILECAKTYIGNQADFIKFTICFMSDEEPLPPPLILGEKCSESIGTEWEPIENCTQSTEGEILLHEAGMKFHSLKKAKPTSVPWILINDRANERAATNLTWVICSYYQGTPPAACRP